MLRRTPILLSMELNKIMQLNKTKGAGDSTGQQLTWADALQVCKFQVSDGKLESTGNNTERFRIHCFGCSTSVSCWRWGLPTPTGIIRAKVLYLLRSADIAALMTACWTSRTTQSYMIITAHYINGDWEIEYPVLQICPIYEAHKSKNMIEVLRNVVVECTQQL